MHSRNQLKRRPAGAATAAAAEGLFGAAPDDLSREEYDQFRALVYEQSGINLGTEKMQLVRARLGKILRKGGYSSYGEYYAAVRADASGQELCRLLDAISTNTTHLFREKTHFEFLADALRRWETAPRARGGVLRIWSAGCSSGEEPHTIAMTAQAALHDVSGLQVKILATDLSTRMLARAQAGLYELTRLSTVPQEFRRRYFRSATNAGEPVMELVPELRRLITFARLNLMSEHFPFRNRFDVIFCRNVMIYFDRPTQQGLISRFARHLRPGGYLLIGHSESLNGLDHPLKYIRPTIYQQPE